jgi:hypothetical protein
LQPPPLRRLTSNRTPFGPRTRKPPRVEFLPDELVRFDSDEFLPDEFVLDDTAEDISVGFVGPSDAPPPRGTSFVPGRIGELARPANGLPSSGGRLRSVRVGWAAAVMVACFGLLGTVRLLKLSTSPALAVRAQPTTSAAPPLLSPLDMPAEPRPEESTQQEQPDQPPPAPLPASTALAVPAAAPAGTVQLSSGEPNGALGAPTGDASDALALKHEAQEALEHSKVSLALEVGQRAVDADPTDAETWLILGAAYLQRGRYTEARGCFKSCVEQATQGPRSECKALLR